MNEPRSFESCIQMKMLRRVFGFVDLNNRTSYAAEEQARRQSLELTFAKNMIELRLQLCRNQRARLEKLNSGTVQTDESIFNNFSRNYLLLYIIVIFIY